MAIRVDYYAHYCTPSTAPNPPSSVDGLACTNTHQLLYSAAGAFARGYLLHQHPARGNLSAVFLLDLRSQPPLVVFLTAFRALGSNRLTALSGGIVGDLGALERLYVWVYGLLCYQQ